MAIEWHKILDYLYLGRERLTAAVFNLLGLKPVKIYLPLLFILNAFNWFLAYSVNRSVSQTLVVLHYNVNLGVNLIGRVTDIYVIPTLGLTFIIINLFLLLNLRPRSNFLVHLLLGFSLLVNLFLIAGIFTVYLVNFR